MEMTGRPQPQPRRPLRVEPAFRVQLVVAGVSMTWTRRHRRGITIMDVVISIAILLVLTTVCGWAPRN